MKWDLGENVWLGDENGIVTWMRTEARIQAMSVSDLQALAQQHVLAEGDDREFGDSHYMVSRADNLALVNISGQLVTRHSEYNRYMGRVSYDEIRNAVLAIRTEKLPDPRQKPNSGSFFKNTVVEQWKLHELLEMYPSMPYYDMGNKMYKIPTGWLIEKAGLKGKLLHGMRIHEKNALVLINESATSYAQLAAARKEIRVAVQELFQVIIEQEPLEMA